MIDFRSDTVTHPTQRMLEAMVMAELGDDVYEDDPTTNELQDLAASMLGKEGALFVPSGTMGNQLALMTHTQKGDEAIVSSHCHIFEHEVGAAAVLSSLNLKPLDFPDGVYDAMRIEASINSSDIHEPPTTLICLENALANGRVVPLENMREIRAMADSHDMRVHLDGARIFNAATSLGVDASEIASQVDSVSCCLSKGLCAPIGSVLVGDEAFIRRARRYRKMLGGGMRQTGVLAAASIIALEEMTGRLEEDHLNAKLLAERLNGLPGVTVDLDSIQVNIVFAYFDVPELDELAPWLAERGFTIAANNGSEIRLLTHYGITSEDVENLVSLISAFISERS